MDLSRALADAGLKQTRPRLLILEALAACDAALTAQELHARLREPGLATVYRTLGALHEAGLLDAFQRGTEQAFRWCGAHHHHHLVCESCGAVTEIEAEEVERWVKRVARDTGFRVTRHLADIHGVCARCQ